MEIKLTVVIVVVVLQVRIEMKVNDPRSFQSAVLILMHDINVFNHIYNLRFHYTFHKFC